MMVSMTVMEIHECKFELSGSSESFRDHLVQCPYLEVRKTDWEQTRGCLQITQPQQDKTPICCLRGQGWLCVVGTQLSGTHCLVTQPGEPCLAEMDAPQQLCGCVFSLCLPGRT